MFNSLVLIMGAKYKIIKKTLYIYTSNKNSISRNGFIKEFNNLEILLYNLSCINNFIKGKDYDKNVYAFLVYTKYIFLNRYYFRVNNKNKEKMKKWIEKYDPNNIDLLGYKDKQELFNQYTTKKRII